MTDSYKQVSSIVRSLLNRQTFESAYAGQAPWEMSQPSKEFVDVAERVTGSVLDARCGTGENALYFAALGRKVMGIDFVEVAISRARRKAEARGLKATFLVKDALTLKDWPERFDNVIDGGLFHVFGDEARILYVEGLATVIKPGGRLFLGCFSDEEPGSHGPRRVSKKELYNAFAHGWSIESIDPTRAQVRRDLEDWFSPGGPKIWFVVVRRMS